MQKIEFLTRQEAAEYLNIKKCTLEAWAWVGKGPVICKFGRSVRYRISDLEVFIEGSKTQSRIDTGE